MGRTRINANQVNEDTLQDQDGDTRVTVEKNADEDKIRFETNGIEQMLIDDKGTVYVTNEIVLDGQSVVPGSLVIDHGIFQNPNSSYNPIYFPSDDSYTERVGPSSVNFQIAPFDGRVVKVQIKSSRDFDSTSTNLTVNFHKGADGSNAYSSTPTATVQVAGAKAWYVMTFDMGAAATFSEGDVIGYSLLLSDSWNGNETVHFTTVVQYDPFA